MATVLKPVSWMLPVRHFLVIVKGVFLKDMPALDVLLNTLPMILIAAITLPIAGWMFSKRLE